MSSRLPEWSVVVSRVEPALLTDARAGRPLHLLLHRPVHNSSSHCTNSYYYDIFIAFVSTFSPNLISLSADDRKGLVAKPQQARLELI